MSTGIALPKTHFRQTIVTDVELRNGKKTQIITIFNNNEINFEEMEIGINTAVNRQVKFYNNIKSIQNTLCSIKKEGLDAFAFSDKVEFN